MELRVSKIKLYNQNQLFIVLFKLNLRPSFKAFFVEVTAVSYSLVCRAKVLTKKKVLLSDNIKLKKTSEKAKYRKHEFRLDSRIWKKINNLLENSKNFFSFSRKTAEP